MYIVPITPTQLTGIVDTAQQTTTANAQLPFQDILQQAMRDAEQTQAVSETDANLLALGEVDDLAQVQINTLKATSALQTTVSLTSRVVSAYKEVMQMSI